MTIHEFSDAFLKFLQYVLSWPVAVLLLCFIFRRELVVLLRDLGHMLRNIGKRMGEVEEAKIGSASFRFSEPKTTHTDVGITNVSAVPTRFETDSFIFRSKRFNFEISYPANEEWISETDESKSEIQSQMLAEQGQILVFMLKTTHKIGEFAPNVNVIIQPVGDMTISQYIAASIDTFAKVGWKVLSHAVDTKTAGASFTYQSRFAETEFANVSRVALSNGLAYLATSTLPAKGDIPQPLRDQLNAILNSFHALKDEEVCERK